MATNSLRDNPAELNQLFESIVTDQQVLDDGDYVAHAAATTEALAGHFADAFGTGAIRQEPHASRAAFQVNAAELTPAFLASIGPYAEAITQSSALTERYLGATSSTSQLALSLEQHALQTGLNKAERVASIWASFAGKGWLVTGATIEESIHPVIHLFDGVYAEDVEVSAAAREEDPRTADLRFYSSSQRKKLEGAAQLDRRALEDSRLATVALSAAISTHSTQTIGIKPTRGESFADAVARLELPEMLRACSILSRTVNIEPDNTVRAVRQQVGQQTIANTDLEAGNMIPNWLQECLQNGAFPSPHTTLLRMRD